MSSRVPISSLSAHQLLRLANFRRDDADDLDVAVGEEGSGGDLGYIDVVTEGAEGDGVTDDTVAIQSAIDAAVLLRVRVHFPAGEYLVSDIIDIAASAWGIRLTGEGATIRYASTVRKAFNFESTSIKPKIRDLAFQGDASDDYAVNSFAALHFTEGTTDFDIEGCTFTRCTPVVTESGNTAAGRARFVGNRVLEAPNAVSLPSYCLATDNFLINEAVVATRSHGFYLFGPCEHGILARNFFKNVAGSDIQIRAGSARYQQKRAFQIVNNDFDGTGTYSIWVGSDDRTNEGTIIISGNTFRNPGSFVNLQGCRDALVDGNVGEWNWEYSGDRTIGKSAINVMHGGVTLDGHINPSTGVKVCNNILIQRHPWFGVVDFDSLPVAAETVTIGAVTYTWVAGAPSSGEVQIEATIAECVEALVNEVRGRGLLVQNVVLRDETDVFHNEFLTNGAPTNRMVIASFDDFPLSETGTSMAVTAVIDNRDCCQYPITATASKHLTVNDNTSTDFQGALYVLSCVKPFITNNTMNGCAIRGHGNSYSVYRGNHFNRTQCSDAAGLRPFRMLSVDDGFSIQEGNGLICEQEYSTIELGGAAGVVNVGDGKARMFLYYGAELYNLTDPDEPQSIFSRWSDNDLVQFYDGGTTHNFTFKRTAPGAGQFNDADSLIALINATGTITATYADYFDAGASPDPELMIDCRAVAGGIAGNGFACWVTTRSETCGLILRDWHASEDMAWFYGGAATAVSTVVFTPNASVVAPLYVQGVDAPSHALAPVAFVADVTPGVCYVLTHAAAAGTEAFAFRAGSQ